MEKLLAAAYLLSGSIGGYLIFKDMQRIYRQEGFDLDVEGADIAMIIVMSIAGPVSLVMGLFIYFKGRRGE